MSPLAATAAVRGWANWAKDPSGVVAVCPPAIVRIVPTTEAEAGWDEMGRAAAAVMTIPSARPTLREERRFGVIAQRMFPTTQSV